MLALRPLKEGDPVVYAPDPLLFGEMEVRAVRKQDGRLVCRVDPDGDSGAYEIFERRELVPSSEAAVAA